MSQKRPFDEVDTDYQEFDFLTGHQSKRQKLLEHDAKKATIKKIETIIRREFARELCNKDAEIELIDERLNEGRRLLDRLRACIVAQHYSKVRPAAIPSSSASALSESHSSVIHPAVKKSIGKTICSAQSKNGRPALSAFAASHQSIESRSRLKKDGQSDSSASSQVNRSQLGGVVTSEQCRGDRFKIVKKLIVGNVSKYLAPDKKEANDKSTHKWMVYVRGPKEEPPIDEFVEKVCFFLHDSYFPNNVVEITQPPFHLTRRGWGEFQVRVRLQCKGPSRKIFNISHQLKLDRTYTGLQTMGAETVVEIKLDKEMTDSLSGRLSRVLQDPYDSPPRQETEIIEPFIKEEIDDDGYEDLVSNEFVPKSRDSLHESRIIRSPSLSRALQTFRKNCNPSASNGSSNSETTCLDLRHFDVFPSISDVESTPFTLTAGSEQMQPTVSESSLRHETMSDSNSFLPESNVTEELTCRPVCGLEKSINSELISVECRNISGEPEDCDNFPDEVVVCNAVSVEPASLDSIFVKPERCDSVLEEIITSDDYGLHNGGIDMEHEDLSIELEGLVNVHEEVVISDTVCVEPTTSDDVSEESDNTQIKVMNKACGVESASCDGEPEGLVENMETEPSDDYTNQEPHSHDEALDVEPDFSVGYCVEPALIAETNVCTLDICSTPEAEQAVSRGPVETPARIKVSEGEEGFVRCRDSSGNVFRIRRHLLQSRSAGGINATKIRFSPATQMTRTSAVNILNMSTPEQLVALPQTVVTSTTTLRQTDIASQINTTDNQVTTCESMTVNRVSLNSTGLQNLVNVTPTEFCVMGRGGKSGGAATFLGPRANKVRGVIGRESADSILVVPCSSSGSLPTRNAVVLPVQRNNDPKLAMPVGVQGVAPVGIRVVTQSTKLGSALPQGNRPKTVVVRSVGLGSNQSQAVLGNMGPGNLVRSSSGGTVTFFAMKRPTRGVAPVSSVRLLPPEVSTRVVATSQVLPAPAGSVSRLQHSQVRPAVRSLLSQVGPVVRSLPSQVISLVRSLPAQANPAVRSLFSQTNPVVRSLSSQVSTVQRSVQQNCSNSQHKVDSPPVFLLVPSEVKSREATPNSPQPAIRHVLFVPKGTKVSPSGLNLPSQLKTKNMTSIQPSKLLSGIAGNQDVALTSVSTSNNSGSKAKVVSILRPPIPPSSSMTSLLKKNPFAQVSVAQGKGTATIPNSIPHSMKSPTGKPAASTPSCPLNLSRTAEALLTTQIGNQTVIVKLDSNEKCGHAQSKKNEELKLNGPLLSAPSIATQENRLLPVVRPREKHLMFKTLRETSQKKPLEDVTANINLQDLESMEDLIRSLAKHFPAYGSNVDRSVHPYCATSWNGFLQWNIGKRRAAELCRAVAVQRKLCSLLNGAVTFRGDAIWSKQRIIKWCRLHLYTPLDSETMVHLGEDQVDKLSDPPEAFLSLTDHKEVLSRLDAMSRMSSTTQDDGNNDDDEDFELDVTSIEESSEKETKKMKRLPVKVMTGAEVIPPSVEAQFVHETAAKIGIRLNAGPVLPDECPDILSSTVEEMIAAATQTFANELVRIAAAKLFESGRNPLNIDVASIYEAIRHTTRYDFLTNQSLGVQEEETNSS